MESLLPGFVYHYTLIFFTDCVLIKLKLYECYENILNETFSYIYKNNELMHCLSTVVSFLHPQPDSFRGVMQPACLLVLKRAPF